MSTAEDAASTSATDLEAPPEFELECRFDDPADPSELTVFAPGERRVATEWLTVDRATAVPLDWIR